MDDTRVPDGLAAAQADSLTLLRGNARAIRIKRQAAFLEGFSLHAGVHLHANDREGLAHLCGYGARSAARAESPLAVPRWTARLSPEAAPPIAPARMPDAGEDIRWQDDVPELQQLLR